MNLPDFKYSSIVLSSERLLLQTSYLPHCSIFDKVKNIVNLSRPLAYGQLSVSLMSSNVLDGTQTNTM